MHWLFAKMQASLESYSNNDRRASILLQGAKKGENLAMAYENKQKDISH
jgi:hypothetical protein